MTSEQAPTAPAPDAAAKSGPTRATLTRDIIINAVMPYATYLALTHYGVATVPALVAGAVFPIAAIIFTAIQQRRLQPIGVIVLCATALSVASALWFTSPFLALAKGALITSVIAVAFLVSLALRHPLIYHLARTGQDQASRLESQHEWDTDPEYRRVLRRITLVWGLGLLIEAAIHLVLITQLSPAVVLPVNEALFWVFAGALAWWTWRTAEANADPAETDSPQSGP